MGEHNHDEPHEPAVSERVFDGSEPRDIVPKLPRDLGPDDAARLLQLDGTNVRVHVAEHSADHDGIPQSIGWSDEGSGTFHLSAEQRRELERVRDGHTEQQSDQNNGP